MTEAAPRFPRPRGPSDLLCEVAGEPSRGAIFSLLTSPGAREWRPPSGEGSFLLMLQSGGWIFKTSLDLRIYDALTLVRVLPRVNEFYAALGYWHPAKRWLIVHDGAESWLCNMTPELIPLPDLRGLRRLAGYCRLPYLCCKAILRHRLTLDPNHHNFAMDRRGLETYYLDDEVYAWRRGRWKSIAPSGLLQPTKEEGKNGGVAGNAG